LLDYLIVMAIAVLAVPHYLSAFVPELGHQPWQLLLAIGAMLWVGWANVRGVNADRFGRVLRLGLVFLGLCIAVIVAGVATEWHGQTALDSIQLGSAPRWDDLLFAAVLACVACTGIEAASGLAPEMRASRRRLKRLVLFIDFAVVVILIGLATVAVAALPPVGGHSSLVGSGAIEAPLLTVVSSFDPSWLGHAFRYLVGLVGAMVLLQAVNGTMIGLSRVTYSLATNRQIPSLLGRLHPTRGTPFVAIVLATLVSIALAASGDVELLAGIFALGATLVFAIAHLSVIALRFREPDAQRIYRVPLSIRVRGGSVPLPLVAGAAIASLGWVSVLILHSGARYVGGAWLLGGILLYVIYRRGQDKGLRQRFTIPAAALQEAAEAEYGSILVPVFGGPLDDDIVGTAGRLASEEGEEGEGGAVIEALYVVEIPMSLPLDARIPDEQVERARAAVRRAKEVGEEYEGVVVATAMVRARSVGSAIVSEAKRRGVEAIVLAAEEPTRMRGGALLGGRGGPRDRTVGDMTRYVVDKAPCRVIVTAAPAQDRKKPALSENGAPSAPI
ncbi:MAG: basic amino acid/polyamine antiporter, family, partial [Thermoleophilaceae bacterium]|nr:basic amino acid/polyamine antiporter, family [Thermoleophilaceae bacterium]